MSDGGDDVANGRDSTSAWLRRAYRPARVRSRGHPSPAV